jgi:GT2 family glycosyltransferase
VTAPALSAVIVAWNSGASLAACAGALRASARLAGVGLELVVVDNASDDGSVDAFVLDPSDIRIRNPLNAGFGTAAAQGMSRASAPWILLVNPDCQVETDFVGALAEAAATVADDVAALVPDMRYASNTSIVNCRGIAVDVIGVPHEVAAGVDAGAALVPGEVFGGSSGCVLLRAEAVRRVGGLELAFFAYLEDVDLAWRLQRAGYKAVYVPGAVALHEGSASAGESSPLKVYLVARNRRLLFRLDGPRTTRARLSRLVVEAGHGAVSTLTGPRVAPWSGRLGAVRLRSYVRFVRRSRAELDGAARVPRLEPRTGLLDTLRRKRALRRELRH